jgi:hypothetical protein
VLALATRVYLSATLRAVNAPLVPLDHARAARAIVAEVESVQAAAGAHADLGPVLDAARRLVERTEALAGVLASASGAATLERANRTLVRLSRLLVPLTYTSGDPFRHDLAVPLPPLAGLQMARELARLEPGSDLYKFTAAGLVRESNRAVHTLDEAAELAEDFIATKD